MKSKFTIGKIAKLFNINTTTLRYYNKIGLFKPYYINEIQILVDKDFLKIREVENAIFNTPFKIISYHLLNIIFSIKVFLY